MFENFIALDFETSYGHIPCSIGIVEFISGVPVSEFYSLIKPIDLKFSPINTRINGICLDDVISQREFCEIWQEIEHFFHDKIIVAHNASTDISILEKTLKHYEIPSPKYKSFCTLAISKSKLKLDNYKLSTIAKSINIEQNNYHNALEDALICGKIFTLLGDNPIEYRYQHKKIKSRIVHKISYLINPIKIESRDIIDILENCSNTLENKTFLFTGKLSLFTREAAEEMVEKHGGKNISAVSKNLNYLVVGEKAGSKLKKAQDIGTIEILDEQQFLNLISE